MNMAPSSPVSLSGLFKKLGFGSDDPTGHVQLGSLEDLQGQEDLLPIPKPGGVRPDVDLYAPTKLSPPNAMAYDQYFPPEPIMSPKGAKFIPGGTFETRQVARFQQLDIELAPYEGLADKLEEQRAEVERLLNYVRVAEAARVAARENVSKLERALKVAEKRSLFQSATRHEQQLALLHSQLDAARDAAAAAVAQEDMGRVLLEEPQRLLDKLEAEGRVQKALTDEQLLILDALYAGPDKGDAAENAAEATVQQLTQRERQVRQALEHHKEAHRLLDSAVLNLERANLAVEKLNTQMRLSEEQGMGPTFGWISSTQLRSALKLFLKAVEEECRAGLAASSFTPLARSEEQEPGSVDRLLRQLDWDTVDAAFKDIAKRERREQELPLRLREVYRDLLESLQWQARFVANIEADARRTEDAASKAKQALWDERVRLLYLGEDRFPVPASPTGPLQHAGAPSPQAAPQPGRLAKQQSWGKLARLISL
ncbi:hypothetical protein KFL_006250040 [Klebsormidium nitens]|uniref:Uncharacterized protein n=1 Tax=Klebsormidium nitens TaxID=105231 RepID=A0A1Y1IHG6_KLENI|nr:hypothetical protein KFL_006250040 [Klebsormidium nitens]|eukprot:GAQ90310.1 hypothetical protein KFL_006250040 [Klebsormidium nitens]